MIDCSVAARRTLEKRSASSRAGLGDVERPGSPEQDGQRDGDGADQEQQHTDVEAEPAGARAAPDRDEESGRREHDHREQAPEEPPPGRRPEHHSDDALDRRQHEGARDEQQDPDGRRDRHRGHVRLPVQTVETRGVADERHEPDPAREEERDLRGDAHRAAQAVEPQQPERGEREGERRPERHPAHRARGVEAVGEQQLVDPGGDGLGVLDGGRERNDPGGGLQHRAEPLPLGAAQRHRRPERDEAERGVRLERRRPREDLGQGTNLERPPHERHHAERDHDSAQEPTDDARHLHVIGRNGSRDEFAGARRALSAILRPWPC